MKVGYVVPVRNEEASLPDFLDSLMWALRAGAGIERRVVFVPNGCEDSSEEMLRRFCVDKELTTVLPLAGRPGIVRAFRAGVDRLGVFDFYGKLDADTCLERGSLEGLEDALAADAAVQAVYCEPTPFPGTVDYLDAACGRPVLYGPRLYLEGRASLYRGDPFYGFASDDPRVAELLCEDIFLSALLHTRCGPGAIKRSGTVYFRPPATRSDFGRMFRRTVDELDRIRQLFPELAPALDALDRPILDADAAGLLRQISVEITDSEREWARLVSTKGGRPAAVSFGADGG